MRSFIQRCALLSGIAVLALASPLAFAATTGGFDTPSGVQTMPIAVEGNAILTLTDTPSNAVVVDGRLQLSGWFGIGTTTPVSPLDIVIPYYPSTPAIHTYAPSVFGNIWIGGTNDFSFDGGSDSAFWFHNTGAASGATAFLWNNQFNLYIANTGNVGIGTTAPKAKLDVNGTIKLGSFTVGSSCSTKGTMGFDPNTNIPIYCNGTTWSAMWSGGGQYQVYLCDAWGNFHPSGVDCRNPNPLTGSCSCPNGLTAHATNDFNASVSGVNSCPQTYYENRGMIQFSCD